MVIIAMKQRVHRAKRHFKRTYTPPNLERGHVSPSSRPGPTKYQCLWSPVFCLTAQKSLTSRSACQRWIFPGWMRERLRHLQSLFAIEVGREREGLQIFSFF